jgi:Domain of unknown function (DUF6457)
MDEWLASASAKLARSVGGDPSDYELDERDVEVLLELARVAAHESGNRTNAPLVCYLVGLARGRQPGKDLAPLTEDVVGKQSP